MQELQRELDRIRTRLTLLENKPVQGPTIVYYPVYIPVYVPQPSYYPLYNPVYCQTNNFSLNNEYKNSIEMSGDFELGQSGPKLCEGNAGDIYRTSEFANELHTLVFDGTLDAAYGYSGLSLNS